MITEQDPQEVPNLHNKRLQIQIDHQQAKEEALDSCIDNLKRSLDIELTRNSSLEACLNTTKNDLEVETIRSKQRETELARIIKLKDRIIAEKDLEIKRVTSISHINKIKT